MSVPVLATWKGLGDNASMLSRLAILLAVFYAGCNGTASESDSGIPDAGLPAASAVDILFVVDDSRSMSGAQNVLARDFESLIQRLVGNESIPTIDLHFGVVTTNLGVGGLEVSDPVCNANRTQGVDLALGDDGILQTKGQVNTDCAESYPAFLSFVCENGDCAVDATAEARSALAADFACVVQMGISESCGMIQPLEATLSNGYYQT
ncbi:MAG: hypothetical protein H6714_00500 [Myxococcales bacterium]|nr:hypothetical protein [Myxococcales bacterium]